ncbi:uncharacterized protein TRAVEDRAFT_165007 [Trametes versicolor FP-101664 SS1]|uniref:uncharacterized protein n=1 Tax=Trametes versicolor (strain FP-101664) TaxID=717944 RepID=UPI0004623F5C|nr:uncharacterized protein TRAVEDRAFT_165007 [Trametes versicolor FP-101664 SS1]EIW60309.1 hypothetical protein TRAVEDRAFT_165007 [Trametes versicolor FP-101664 SS1]
MGSAASKPARRLAKTAPPGWAGARTPNPAEHAPSPRPAVPLASETKTEAIMKDGGDTLLANLQKLGQVRVDHNMRTIKPAAEQAQRIHDSRLLSEDQARSSRQPHNRLVAASLTELLEERKYAPTPKALEELPKKYAIDSDKVERLARYVNSVSVHPDLVKRWVSEDGAEQTTMLASWVNPKAREVPP